MSKHYDFDEFIIPDLKRNPICLCNDFGFKGLPAYQKLQKLIGAEIERVEMEESRLGILLKLLLIEAL